jgi:hypothetical protein
VTAMAALPADPDGQQKWPWENIPGRLCQAKRKATGGKRLERFLKGGTDTSNTGSPFLFLGEALNSLGPRVEDVNPSSYIALVSHIAVAARCGKNPS